MTTLLCQRVLFHGKLDMMERENIPSKIGRNFFTTTMQDVLPENAAEVVKVIHRIGYGRTTHARDLYTSDQLDIIAKNLGINVPTSKRGKVDHIRAHVNV